MLFKIQNSNFNGRQAPCIVSLVHAFQATHSIFLLFSFSDRFLLEIYHKLGLARRKQAVRLLPEWKAIR